jgi:hypothetical protein
MLTESFINADEAKIKQRIMLHCASGRHSHPTSTIAILTGSKVIPCTREAEVRASMTEEELSFATIYGLVLH